MIASRCLMEKAATPSVSPGVSFAWRITASATAAASARLVPSPVSHGAVHAHQRQAEQRASAGAGEGSTSSRFS